MGCLLESEDGFADKHSLIYLMDEVVTLGIQDNISPTTLHAKFNNAMVDAMGYDNIPALQDTLEYITKETAHQTKKVVGDFPFRIENIELTGRESVLLSFSIYDTEDNLYANIK